MARIPASCRSSLNVPRIQGNDGWQYAVFSAASVRACALRAATSENIPDSGFRRKRIPKWNHS